MKLQSLRILSIFIICFLFVIPAKYGLAAWADHLVISEVQISGGPGQTTNDFIEIYNPTQSVVDISGWKLRKRTQSGAESSIKVFSDGKSILAHGFFLWANSNDGYDQTIEADESSTQTIADNNSLGFFSADDILIDALVWGSGHTNPFFEGNTTSTPVNPEANQSLERKPGVSDGNGEDTEDNFQDFFLQINPNPQNYYTSSTPPIRGFVCGNKVCEDNEDEQNCPEDCLIEEYPVCGNNIREGNEDCDGSDSLGKSCIDFGFSSGSLTCNLNCSFNTLGCINNNGSSSSYSPPSSNFNPSDVVINEFISDPADGEEEWIELYNNKSSVINLEGWYLEDGTETKNKLNGQINANNFFIIDDLKFYLNNKGDIILLKDANGNLIDSVAYGDWDDGDLLNNAVVANDPKSLGRKQDGFDNNNDLNDFIILALPTKGKTNNDNQENENIISDSGVYFNEALPNPEGDDEAGEFIELKNFSNSSIDLGGWKIRDASDKEYTISSQDFSTTLILAGGLFVLPRTITKISLNNSGGETIKLYNQNNELVSSFEYNEVAKENHAYARDKNQNWQWTNQPTLGQENIFDGIIEEENLTEDLDEFLDIVLNEVLANPEGSDSEEWIEIYNKGNKEVNLKNWQIDDQDGGSKAYKISADLVIKPTEYLVFKKEETKISLNNDQDHVRLISPAGAIISEIFYEDAESDYSYARINNDWFWTKVLTPGLVNIIDESGDLIFNILNENLEIQETAIENVREFEIGRQVKTSGVVAVEPGILGTQIFYLSGSGIQVYFYKKEFPDLKVGDLIEITGEISESRGERRIKIAQKEDIIFIKKLLAPIAKEVKIEEIGEELEGNLVMIKGQLIENSGYYLYLDDGSDEAKVYLKQSTGIKKPKLKEGDWLKITGIVSQLGDEYRILPRYQIDIELIENKNNLEDVSESMTGSLAVAGELDSGNFLKKIETLGLVKYFIISTLFLIVILIALIIKKKK